MNSHCSQNLTWLLFVLVKHYYFLGAEIFPSEILVATTSKVLYEKVLLEEKNVTHSTKNMENLGAEQSF